MLHGVHGVDITDVYVLLVSRFALAHLKTSFLSILPLYLGHLALMILLYYFFRSILDP